MTARLSRGTSRISFGGSLDKDDPPPYINVQNHVEEDDDERKRKSENERRKRKLSPGVISTNLLWAAFFVRMVCAKLFCTYNLSLKLFLLQE